jgi:16S rRNA (adenine(1408)-N(1))-methyltransferase
MRVLQGSKVIEAPAGWREGWARVVIDLGTGDGRFPYTKAREDPASLYAGIDPDAAAMAEYAFRASRKPARGGVTNVLYVVASVEQLPPELSAAADLVYVVFPWGSLLRGLLAPEPAALRAVAGLVKPGGGIEIVVSFEPEHDTGVAGAGELPVLDEARIDALIPAYAEAGIAIESRRRLTADEALAIPSTWSRRLLHARPRDVFSISGRRV